MPLREKIKSQLPEDRYNAIFKKDEIVEKEAFFSIKKSLEKPKYCSLCSDKTRLNLTVNYPKNNTEKPIPLCGNCIDEVIDELIISNRKVGEK